MNKKLMLVESLIKQYKNFVLNSNAINEHKRYLKFVRYNKDNNIINDLESKNINYGICPTNMENRDLIMIDLFNL